jgi:1-acyl-sn-glycerol-3-phosphate acyltransferase
MIKRAAAIAYQSFACWGLFAAASGLFGLLAPLLWAVLKAGGVAEPRHCLQSISYRFHRWYVGALMQIVPTVRLEVHPPGGPAGVQGPAVFISNHGSVVDLLLLNSVIDHASIVGKRSMAHIPIFGWALMLLGMIFVDRKRKFDSGDVFGKLRERLRKGERILTFPQGSRALPWSRRTVKRGLFKVLMEERTPIVPIAVVGTNHLLKKGQFFFVIPPRFKAEVFILPPVAPEGDPESLEDVTALRDRIVEAVGSVLDRRRDLRREED